MRCPLGATPKCKVNTWKEELLLLRQTILSEKKLRETSKWGVPCYTYNNKNILLLGAFKEFCSVSFLKGALLKDEHKLLEFAGKNSQAAKFIRFTNKNQVLELTAVIKKYIQEAIEIEDKGLKVSLKKTEDYPIPGELQLFFDKNKAFKKAFDSLTPGRKRGYYIFFSAAKQSKTREERIKKYIPKIMEGKGMHD